MDFIAYNREAWDRQVRASNRWTVPASPELVARARRGDVEILLTPTKPVPRDWLIPLAGKDVLCLASGGGQQGPLLAAAGARVTVYDLSRAQLAQDRACAEREGLSLTTVEGDMRRLEAFADQSFDLIVHPVSNCFVDDVRAVWSEAFRVLRKGGELLAGVSNPIIFTFDPELQHKGVLQVKYPLPYSDVASLSDAERRRYTDKDEPLCFAHSLEDQLGGQLDAGFVLVGLYEDKHVPEDPTARWLPGFIATRARRA